MDILADTVAEMKDAYKILNTSRHITEADRRRATFVISGVVSILGTHLLEQSSRIEALEGELHELRAAVKILAATDRSPQ